MHFDVTIDGRQYRVEVERTDASGSGGQWHCRVDGREIALDAVQTAPEVFSLIVGGRAVEIERERVAGAAADGTVHLAIRGRRYQAEVRDPRALRSRRGADVGAEGPKNLTAPMPGKVLRLLVSEGSAVEAGQGVLVIEAMKMQNEIKAPKSGTVSRLAAVEGAAVNAGDVLAVIE